MFDQLFVEMGPMGSSLALLLVVALPAVLVAGETLRIAQPRLVACLAALRARLLR